MASVSIIQQKDLELEDVLSLEMIRHHTKTDDTPHVTDEQLILYRQAGFEAAELYCGIFFFGVATVQEVAESKAHPNNFRQRSRTVLAYPSIDGMISIYGTGKLDQTVTVNIPPGSRRISIPTLHEALDVSPCCGSGRGAVNFGLKMLYRTGIADPSKVPSGVKTGVLRYIAWAVSNPGDELLTVRNRLGTTETGLIGTNNGAWASGAIEAWRMYRPPA